MSVDTVRRDMWIERRIACAGFCRAMSCMITASGFGEFIESIEMWKRNIHLDDGRCANTLRITSRTCSSVGWIARPTALSETGSRV